MSSTRRDPAQQFHAEAFASSDAYERGLAGNLVARRASLLDDPEERAILYMLQQLSHSKQGLSGTAQDILDRYPERIGTRAMHALKVRRSAPLPVETVKTLREEVPGDFPLTGELSFTDSMLLSLEDEEMDWRQQEIRLKAAAQPETYSLKAFFNHCAEAATAPALEGILRKLCLDPEMDFAAANRAAWFLDDLREILLDYRRQLAQAGEEMAVDTEIKRQVFEALDFALEARSFVFIEGLERLGKTTAAKAFCAAHPGRAVYVALEPGKDKAGFFRTLARALGTASTAGRKTLDIQARVEDMLIEGDVMLVIDEAHYAYPQTARPNRAPERLDWIRTALVDRGVPVALLSTPQFDRQCTIFEQRLGWNSRQFKGRIGYHCTLPDTISPKEMRLVAEAKCPSASPTVLARLGCQRSCPR